MARTKRSAKLDTRSARLKLPCEKNHMEQLTKGLYLNYRRPKNNTAGTWSVCFLVPGTNQQKRKGIGAADDYADTDGITFLNYSQAQTKAIELFKRESIQARDKKTGRKTIDIDKFTVADALQFLWERKEGGDHAKGLEIDKLRTNKWIIPELGDIPLTDLTKDRIEQWLKLISKYSPSPTDDDEAKANKIRAKKVTGNRILAILKKALNEVYRENDTIADSIKPCWQRVKPHSVKPKRREGCLDEIEEIKLINACPPDFRELVIAALETGCRYGELIRLRVKDYAADPENPAIYIEDSKSGKPRWVPLGSERAVALFDELTAQRQSPKDLLFQHRAKRITRGESQEFREYIKKANTRAELPRKDKHTITLDGFMDAWRDNDQRTFMKDACIRAGIEPMGFHQLRHTFTERLLRKGVQRRYVADVLGHRDTRMLDLHYEHISDVDKAQAIRAAMAGRGIIHEPKFMKLKPKKPKIG